jgi:hypothetical protein
MKIPPPDRGEDTPLRDKPINALTVREQLYGRSEIDQAVQDRLDDFDAAMEGRSRPQ